MSPPIFIVESSNKASSIFDLLGQKIDTLVIRTTPLEVILSSQGEGLKNGRSFLFEPNSDNKETTEKILSSLENEIYLAFDRDHRGEYWSWMIYEFIDSNGERQKRPKRIYFDSLTREGIQTGIENPSDDYYKKGFSFQIGLLFDRLLGDHLERLTDSIKGPGGLPMRFPILTLLFFLAERENEIREFSPSNKGLIVAKLSSREGEFEAKLKTAGNITEDGLLKSKDEFKKVMSLLKEEEFQAKTVSSVSKKFPPPVPFNTLSLVQEAYLQLKMPPDKTMRLARELFHGIKVDEINHGLISFFLTAETSLPKNVSSILRESIPNAQGEASPDTYRIANEGEDLPIIPLMPHITTELVAKALSEEAADLYGLIRARALASQMGEASGENIEVIFHAGDECAFSAGKTYITEKGHFRLYQSMGEKDLIADSSITNIQEGQVFDVVKTFVEPTSGIPPEYYTLETIFSDLIEMGIGMDSMLEAGLTDLLQMGYLEIASQGTLHPRENCSKLVNLIDRILPNMPGLNLSAYFMQTVDEVTSGRKELSEALSQFDQILHMHGNTLTRAGISTIEVKNKETSQGPSPDVDMTQKQAIEIVGEKKTRDRPIIIGTAPQDSQADSVTAFEFHSMKEPPIQKEQPTDQIKIKDKTIEKDKLKSESLSKAEDSHFKVSKEPETVSAPPEDDAPMGAPPLEVETGKKTEVPEHERLPETKADRDTLSQSDQEIGEEIVDVKPETSEQAAKEKEARGKELLPEILEITKEIVSAGEEPEYKTEGEEPEERYCPDCGRAMRLKEDIHGKFWGCEGFPECRHTESFNKLVMKMICPVCHKGEVITERTQVGKQFYVCSEKDCEFITWYLPHAVTCPECKNPFLVEKKDSKGRILLRCPMAGCHYVEIPSDSLTSTTSPKVTSPKKTPKVKKVIVKAKGGRRKPTRKVVRRVRVKAK